MKNNFVSGILWWLIESVLGPVFDLDDLMANGGSTGGIVPVDLLIPPKQKPQSLGPSAQQIDLDRYN